MNENQMRDMEKLDTLAETAGGYVSPMLENNPCYDYRAILKHCKDRNIDPGDLTVRELDKFIVI